MITTLKIEGFKAIDKEVLKFKPITILTGTNSSGKSSVLQCIIKIQSDLENFIERKKNIAQTFVQNSNKKSKFKTIIQPLSEIRNKSTNAKEVIIDINYSSGININFSQSEDNSYSSEYRSIENSKMCELHYLSADRQSINRSTNTEGLSGDYIDSLGKNTTYILAKNRNLALRDEMCADKKTKTLDHQLEYWLSKIVQQKITSTTELIEIKNDVTFFYIMNDIPNISPDSVGTGQNHIVHILLMCLLAKKGDIVIIENPELHLHPKAQAVLSEFFTMIANAGIQLIIETHSEHVIHKFCHEVYKEHLSHNNIIIYYKASVEQGFESIYINKRGHYSNEEGSAISFPNGFFDATLSEVLEVS